VRLRSEERRLNPEGSTATGTRVIGASPIFSTMGRSARFQIQGPSSITGLSTSGVDLTRKLRNWTTKALLTAAMFSTAGRRLRLWKSLKSKSFS